MPRQQFSLKAIMVIVVVLSLPLGMTVSGEPGLAATGPMLAIPVLLGCIGYLFGRWTGAGIGVLLACIAMCFIAYLYSEIAYP